MGGCLFSFPQEVQQQMAAAASTVQPSSPSDMKPEPAKQLYVRYIHVFTCSLQHSSLQVYWYSNLCVYRIAGNFHFCELVENTIFFGENFHELLVGIAKGCHALKFWGDRAPPATKTSLPR